MRTLPLALLAAALCLSACKGAAAGEIAQSPATAKQPAQSAQPAKAAVAKIVFIDKEHACECTQKAIDASWAALQAALTGASLPVERIHMDTQAAFAAAYRDQRPMMAVPGLYLLGADGKILELLQGEVTEAQVRAALQ